MRILPATSILAACLLCAAAASAGEIYRCTDANGAVSYTNLACPDQARVEPIASYEPDDYVPPPPAERDDASQAAEDSANAAREAALEAREAALQARVASELAREQETEAAQPAVQYGSDSPLWIPAYAPLPRHRGHDGRHGHDRVLHLQGPETPIRNPHWATPSGSAGTHPFSGHH